ncbi:hypothetical protein, partial [Bradyrhizobium sp. 25ACV]
LKNGGTKNGLLTKGGMNKDRRKNAFPKNGLLTNGRAAKESRATQSSGLKPMVWLGRAEARIECDIMPTAIAFGRGRAEIRA